MVEDAERKTAMASAKPSSARIQALRDRAAEARRLAGMVSLDLHRRKLLAEAAQFDAEAEALERQAGPTRDTSGQGDAGVTTHQIPPQPGRTHEQGPPPDRVVEHRQEQPQQSQRAEPQDGTPGPASPDEDPSRTEG